MGRLQFNTADSPPPASRKGQLLLRLEGQVGQPVTVQLPELAQEYQERLPNRVSGTTGLPHRCTSPARAQGAAAAGGSPGALAELPDFGSIDVLGSSGARSSKSVSLPVKGTLGPPGARPVAAGGAAAAAAGVAAAGAGLASVHSDPLLDRPGVLAVTAGAVEEQETDQDAPSGSVRTQLRLALGLQSPESAAASSTGGARLTAPPHLQHGQGSTAVSSKHATGKPAAVAAAVAAESSCVVDMQGMGLRHDSFGSVEDVAVNRAGSLPHILAGGAPGLTPDADAAPDGVHGPRSKSYPQVVRPVRGSGSSSSRQGGAPGQPN